MTKLFGAEINIVSRVVLLLCFLRVGTYAQPTLLKRIPPTAHFLVVNIYLSICPRTLFYSFNTKFEFFFKIRKTSSLPFVVAFSSVCCMFVSFLVCIIFRLVLSLLHCIYQFYMLFIFQKVISVSFFYCPVL